VVCTGADPEKIALVDNFCWPDPVESASNPDGAVKLRELVDTCEALAEVVRAYEMPLISGKDSMKNDFNRGGIKISVLPTLLVTALGHVPDVSRALKPHARSGQKLFLLRAGFGPGEGSAHRAGSPASGYFGVMFRDRPGLAQRKTLPGFDLVRTRMLYQAFHEAWKQGLISAAHDVSEGGVLFAAFEMTLLRRLGIQLKGEADDLAFWCSEDPGRILVAIAPEQEEVFLEQLQGFETVELGHFDDSGALGFIHGRGKGPSQLLAPLRASFREAL
jgi:phosphoribosylformylglycinamidine (FGAM) synthase-like enzyme